MKHLIERKANIEAKTRHWPHNTAMTLAAGQGCGTMWEVLREAGADTRVRNSDGKGQLQLGKNCSSTVETYTRAAKVPDTHIKAKRVVAPNKSAPEKVVRRGQLNAWKDQQAESRHEWSQESWQRESWSQNARQHSCSQPSEVRGSRT